MLNVDQLRARIEILEEQQARQTGGGGPTTFGAATVVWRPGGVTSDNVFVTWAEVVAAVSKMNGAVTIAVDMDLAAAVIPAGAWDLRPVGISGPVTLTAAGKLTLYYLQFVTIANAAVSIHGLTGLDGIQIDNRSTVDVVTISAALEQKLFRLQGYAAIYQSVLAGAANAFIHVTNVGGAITLEDSAFISSLDGGTNAIRVNVGSFLQLLIDDESGIDTNQLVAPAGTAVVATSGAPIPPFATYAAQAGAPTIIPSGVTQKGTAAILVGTGKSAVIPAIVNGVATSIQCTLKTPVGDALTVKYAALAADRIDGAPGSFKISALIAAGGGAINGADTSTIDWEVVN